MAADGEPALLAHNSVFEYVYPLSRRCDPKAEAGNLGIPHRIPLRSRRLRINGSLCQLSFGHRDVSCGFRLPPGYQEKGYRVTCPETSGNGKEGSIRLLAIAGQVRKTKKSRN